MAAFTPTATYPDSEDKKMGGQVDSVPEYHVEEGEMLEIQAGHTSADPALAFVGAERVTYTLEEGKRVLRKIDCNILPILMWVYMVQFADKTSLNYASVMGIRTDAHLNPESQEYSWVSSIFYAGYIAWE